MIYPRSGQLSLNLHERKGERACTNYYLNELKML